MMSTAHQDRGVDIAAVLAGIAPTTSLTVSDLTLDSRAVQPGAAFVALAGTGARHGLDFAAEAARRGAVALLFDPAERGRLPALPESVRPIAVPGLHRRLGRIAARYFGEPAQALEISGITGTNGKTTCAWLLAQALAHCGRAAAYSGTLGWGRLEALESATHTTADVITTHRQLAALRAMGIRDVAMEVSSHALHQARVAEVRFHTTAFTNLSRDHLDYHGTLADYGAAKELLFRQSGVAHAILNVTDPYVREAATRLPAGVALTTVWCASDGETQPALHPPLRPWKSFLHAQHVAATPTGLVISGASDRGPFELRSRLVGRFNAENLLVVLGLLLAQQVELADALAALAVATPPPGRMETFRAGASQPTVIVDYAHTPDALAKVLAAARAHCTGRLYCVFGCGGDRDTGKRAEMGAIAESLADRLVLTDDNPRTEDGDAIIAMIRAGLRDATLATVERDRARAIALAVREARAGDVVVVAGKGHEDYQIYGTERRAFSDREVVTRCLGERA